MVGYSFRLVLGIYIVGSIAFEGIHLLYIGLHEVSVSYVKVGLVIDHY